VSLVKKPCKSGQRDQPASTKLDLDLSYS